MTLQKYLIIFAAVFYLFIHVMKKKDNAEEVPAKPESPELEMRDRVRKKYGGRQKGTQNKVTAITKSVVSNLLSDYYDSGLMASDFVALDPKDRIECAAKLFPFVLPKMQSTSVDITKTPESTRLSNRLAALSKDNEDGEEHADAEE